MTILDEINVKSDLLCKGMRVTDNAKRKLLAEFPDFFTKGIMHSINISFSATNVNVSVADGFATSSPYLLDEHSDDFFISNGEITFPVGFFGALPKTDTVVDDYARLHSTGCVTIWPSNNCCYDKKGEKCRFCSIVKINDKPLDVIELADGLKKLFQKSKGNMLNFSGGTYLNPDNMADYWISLVTEIRKFSDCKIAIELAPPSDLSKLKKLRDAGCNAAIMNLEVADDALRRKVCPGKSQISHAHYHEAMKYAVDVFGYGQVSSVLIAGIQPKEDIIAECDVLTKMGVFPTVMPIRPLDNTDMGEMTCSPDDLKEIALKLGKMLHDCKLDYKKQEGCTKCGGCSIENDCYRLLS